MRIREYDNGIQRQITRHHPEPGVLVLAARTRREPTDVVVFVQSSGDKPGPDKRYGTLGNQPRLLTRRSAKTVARYATTMGNTVAYGRARVYQLVSLV